MSTPEDQTDLTAREERVANKGYSDQGDGGFLRAYPSWLKWLCALVTVASGVFCGVVFKWQNKVEVRACPDCSYAPFEGALYQTQLMFIGEFLALFVYFIDTAVSARVKKANLFDFATDAKYYERDIGPWWVWPICSLIDFAATLMVMLSLRLTYASTVQMLRNLLIVETAALQPLIVRKAVTVHETIGVIIITGAMVLSAVPAVTTPDESADASTRDTITGVVLTLCGTTIQSVQFLLEEFFMRKGRSSPLRTVGFEGLGGIVWSFVAWPICQKAGLENIYRSWYASVHSGLVTTITVIYLPVVAVFNVAGIATTQLGSGLFRGICFALRSPLVWIVSLILKWQNYENWSLASAIVFCFGFAVYINALGFRHHHPVDRWLSKPVHCCNCITDRALDTPYDNEDQDRSV